MEEVVDQRVSLKGYQGTLRQVLILDLDHDEPTILLTNDKNCKLKPIITRYARRMLVKNGLSDAVDFFHLDVLSSAVALNVDFDVLLTVLGSGIYRMFVRMLHGYERAQARRIFRRFLDTSAPRRGVPEGSHRTTPQRTHNPLLIGSGLIGRATQIPWWHGRTLRIQIP